MPNLNALNSSRVLLLEDEVDEAVDRTEDRLLLGEVGVEVAVRGINVYREGDGGSVGLLALVSPKNETEHTEILPLFSLVTCSSLLRHGVTAVVGRSSHWLRSEETGQSHHKRLISDIIKHIPVLYKKSSSSCS